MFPGTDPINWSPRANRSMVKVLEIDRSRRRLALSVRRVLVDDE